MNKVLTRRDIDKLDDLRHREIQEELEKFDFLSIDIFDTIICRATQHPADVFRFIEKTAHRHISLDLPNFFATRIDAETMARERARYRGVEEVTLNEIYDFVQSAYNLDSESLLILKNLEVEYELNLCYLSSFGKFLEAYLRHSYQRCVLISDMYLSENHIRKILDNCGFTQYEEIFVSSDRNKTKQKGSLFSDVVKYFGVSPQNILNVGDNLNSDKMKAHEAGLNAVHRPAHRNIFRSQKLWKDVSVFNVRSNLKNLFNSLYVDHKCEIGDGITESIRDNEDEYWEAIGWLILAPVATSLAIWLRQSCENKGIDRLAFLARDGKFPKQVFDALFGHTSCKTLYLAASRRMLTIPFSVLSGTELSRFYCHVADQCESAADFVALLPGAESLAARLEDLGLSLNQPIGGISDRLFALIGENAGLIPLTLADERANVVSYLESELGGNDPVGLFDLGWRGSLQAAIARAVPDLSTRLIGHYFGTSGHALDVLNASELPYVSFSMSNGYPDNFRAGCQLHTDVIEFLFSADHPSVETVVPARDGYKWIYGPSSDAERKAQSIASKIQKAALRAIQFSLERVPIEAIEQIDQHHEVLQDFFNFLSHPNEIDAKHFAAVNVFSGIGDQVGTSLVNTSKTESLVRRYERSRWRSAFMNGLPTHDRARLAFALWSRRNYRITRTALRRIF